MDNLPENLKKIIIQTKEFIQNNQYFNHNYAIVAFVLFLIYYIIFDKAIELITFIMSLAYPGYMSFKALQQTDSTDDLRKWVIYWIFFAVINLFEQIAWLTLNFIPMYHLIKFGLILWLFNARLENINSIYQKSIVYFLNQNQESIDKYLDKICQKTNELRLKIAKSLLDNDDKKNL